MINRIIQTEPPYTGPIPTPIPPFYVLGDVGSQYERARFPLYIKNISPFRQTLKGFMATFYYLDGGQNRVSWRVEQTDKPVVWVWQMMEHVTDFGSPKFGGHAQFGTPNRFFETDFEDYNITLAPGETIHVTVYLYADSNVFSKDRATYDFTTLEVEPAYIENWKRYSDGLGGLPYFDDDFNTSPAFDGNYPYFKDSDNRESSLRPANDFRREKPDMAYWDRDEPETLFEITTTGGANPTDECLQRFGVFSTYYDPAIIQPTTTTAAPTTTTAAPSERFGPSTSFIPQEAGAPSPYYGDDEVSVIVTVGNNPIVIDNIGVAYPGGFSDYAYNSVLKIHVIDPNVGVVATAVTSPLYVSPGTTFTEDVHPEQPNIYGRLNFEFPSSIILQAGTEYLFALDRGTGTGLAYDVGTGLAQTNAGNGVTITTTNFAIRAFSLGFYYDIQYPPAS